MTRREEERHRNCSYGINKAAWILYLYMCALARRTKRGCRLRNGVCVYVCIAVYTRMHTRAYQRIHGEGKGDKEEGRKREGG